MVTLFHSCAPRAQSTTTHYPAIQSNPDYNNLDYWAAHPGKKDPSDSIAKPLEANYKFDSSIDVFFLHPTTLTDRDDSSNNASIGNNALNVKTDQTTILFQASVFNEYRVYAPRYRQAHIRSYFKDARIQRGAVFALLMKM
jgi:hypothetical protein